MQVAAPYNHKPIAEVTFEIVGTCTQQVWGRSVDVNLTSLLERAGLAPFDYTDRANDRSDCLLIRGDYYFDRSAVEVLLASGPNCFVVDGEGDTVDLVAVYCLRKDRDRFSELIHRESVPTQFIPPDADFIRADAPPVVYDYELRRTSVPFIRKVSDASVPEIERMTFDLAYKGVTDLVTKYVYPWPAFQATRLAARAGLSPNSITFASLILVFAVTALFAQGQFATALVLGFAMSFLDTLDGKLARVTQTSSRVGKHFDHLIDLIHPPFWWAAWWWGVDHAGAPDWLEGATIVTVVGYVGLRLQEWRFKRRLGVRIHVWKPFDSKFRLITSRRNPNLLLLSGSLVAGDPALGMLALAAWTILSFGVHSVRWVQAEAEAARNGPLRSWLEASPADS